MKTKLKARRAKIIRDLARVDRKIAVLEKALATLEPRIFDLKEGQAKAA